MDLATWRSKKNGEKYTLPSGLVVRVRRVGLIDLAEQGEIPAPLVGLVEELLERNEVRLTLDDFKAYGEVALMVTRAAITEPAITDEPTDDTIGVAELDMADRISVFNHCNEGGRRLRPFREEPEGAVEPVED